MDRLDELESDAVYVVREAYARFKNLALLWSIGKDSTVVLWLARKAFFGKVPFPVVHIDTGFKFKEIYEFRDRYAEEWNLELIVSRNARALESGMRPEKGKFECCTALKTQALKTTVRERGLKALLLGIRRDEHGIRAKERQFSPRTADFRWNYRDQPAELWDLYRSRVEEEGHLRVHPLLRWTELDVWEYVQRESIPTVGLYFAKNGKRYRSIGCRTCCTAVSSRANTVKRIVRELRATRVGERSGRAQDKEDTYTMQNLRSLGYM